MTNSTENKTATELKEKKSFFSSLWVFAMFNYLYCDVISLIDPAVIKSLLTGHAGSIQINQGFLLGSSILMEIPIAMVLMSRILKYKANRLANIIAGSIMTIVQFSSLFVGTAPTPYYLFFSTIEITCTLIIVVYAWRWPNPESITNNKILLEKETLWEEGQQNLK